MHTKDQALDAAAQVLADWQAQAAGMTPEEIAAEAHVPGGPTLKEIAQRIRDDRARG